MLNHLTAKEREQFLAARNDLIEFGSVWVPAWIALALTKVPEHVLTDEVSGGLVKVEFRHGGDHGTPVGDVDG